MGLVELDEEIEGADGKTVFYVQTSRTRLIPSRLALLKWILSVVERGHYVRRLRLSTSDGTLHDNPGTAVDADPNLRTFRRPAKSPGRPAEKKRRGETDDEKRRRQQRDRQERSRQKKRQDKALRR